MSNSKTSILYSENFILLVVVLAMLSNIEHAASVYHSLSHSIFQTSLANWVYASIVVLIIDLAVLVLVINGRHVTAGCYALGMFFINVVYYGGMNELQVVELATGNQINRVVSIVIYSVMFTYSIYTFSRMYLERISKAQQQDESEQKISSLTAQVSNLNAQLEQLISKYNAELSKKEVEWEQVISRKQAEISKLDALVEQLNARNKQALENADAEMSKAVSATKQAVAESSKLKMELEQTNARLNLMMEKVTCPHCKYVANDAYALNAHKKSCSERKKLLLASITL